MINILLIILFVLLSAFFSCTETAFSKANEIRLKNKLDNGEIKAKHSLWVVQNFDKTLTAILIGNNIVNLGCSALVTYICTKAYGDIGPAIATGATTLVILTFGEIIPKCFGIELSDEIVLYTGLVLRIFTYVLYPFVYLFIGIKTLFLKLFKVDKKSPSVTEDELKYIVETIEEEGILEEQESEMVRSALEFDDKTAQEILTPRVDVTAIEIGDDIENIKDIIFKEKYSRIPVYENDIDNIVGILHTTDFLRTMIQNESCVIKDIIKPAHFIYKSMKLIDLLNDFKNNKLHIAIVTDEYGGMLGIVTMEDLLEEIVGDIWDEDEEIEKTYTKLKDGRYLVSGDMDLEDLFKLYNLKNPDDISSISVGGFIVENFGDIPKVNQKIKYESLVFTVKRIKNNRIISAIVENTND